MNETYLSSEINILSEEGKFPYPLHISDYLSNVINILGKKTSPHQDVSLYTSWFMVHSSWFIVHSS